MALDNGHYIAAAQRFIEMEEEKRSFEVLQYVPFVLVCCNEVASLKGCVEDEFSQTN